MVGLVLTPVGGTGTEVRRVSDATASGPFRGEALARDDGGGEGARMLVPIGDENAGRRLTPFVNYALIAVNVAVFLLQLLVGGLSAAFFVAWGVQPVEVVAFQEWQTVFTSMFLHGGLWHLIGNMLFLHVFGDNIEDAMGHARYLIFYLLCGAAAAFAQIATDPFSAVPIVGASGAVSGVLGAYIVLFPQGRIRSLLFLGIFGTVVMVPAWVQLGLWFAIQLVLGVLALGAKTGGGVAFFAHVGGFVAGLLLVWLFADRGEVAHQREIRADSRAAWAARKGVS
ncbi:MAG TPA: rhomboid family intramembrane serine protease [Thermomicrobiales bacterium]|nr:rhomboid family intramembrane serine protease [Thermomicrobiales bacterium]